MRRRRRRGRSGWSWVALLVFGLAGFVVLREQSSSQAGPQADAERAGQVRGRARSGVQPAPSARIPPGAPFHSAAACEAHLRARPAPRSRAPRAGTWNVRWFPHGSRDRAQAAQRTDINWLACAIASLDVDLLAVQEFLQDEEGRRALRELTERLDALTSGRWRAYFDECRGDGFQHVGLLFDSRRVELTPPRVLSALNPGRSACDRSLRPGLHAYARFVNGGPDLHVVSLHLDSGETPRDFANRARSLAALPRVLAELSRAEPDRDLLLLGDFNTMGCKQCSPPVAASSELANMDAQLAAFGLRRIGAPAEHACSHYYRGRAASLDHIVAPAGMEELSAGARVEAHGPCRHLSCGPPARGEDVHAWQYLSDHCPLAIELAPGDRDP